MNLWDFRSIVSIIEHEGLTLVMFLPGTSIDVVTRKILDLGYACDEFRLLPGKEEGLVDFRVHSDEEFPLYLCLSQIFNAYPFSEVTIEGEVFANDVKEIEASGGRLLGDLVISFRDTLDAQEIALVEQELRIDPRLAHVSVENNTLRLPVLKSVKMGEIVQQIHGIARVEHVHGTFAFNIDPP